MRIAFIATNYPTVTRPYRGTFVQQFVWAMARQGHQCIVINPISLWERCLGSLPPSVRQEDAGLGKEVSVHHPRFLSFSSRRIGRLHTGTWTHAAFTRCVLREVARMSDPPDLVYGHFLYPSGRVATIIGQREGVPSVIGVGENSFWTVDVPGRARAQRDLEDTTGVIAVSRQIHDALVSELGVPDDRILLAPNGVDLQRFKPISQQTARAKVGLNTTRFVVAFVGSAGERKGGQRLVKAVDGLSDIGLVMLGGAPETYQSENVLFSGRIPHGDVAMWLNAADAFALPTLSEGSCNAVIEAMACGLPVITSRGMFMDDIVDDESALRVDPHDISALRAAVLRLRNDPAERERYIAGALRRVERLSVDSRAMKVSAWMSTL